MNYFWQVRALLGFVGLALSTSALADEPACIIDDSHPWSECSPNFLGPIAAAEKLVRAYFKASSREQYAMLAPERKEALKAMKIENAEQYAAHVGLSEFVWGSPKVVSVRYFAPDGASIETLTAWDSEGYKGVRTVLFEMARISGQWKILSVVY
jgi:hypothetical protein